MFYSSFDKNAFIDEGVHSFGAVIDGCETNTTASREIFSPYDGALVARVGQADHTDIEAAIQAAQKAFQITREMPGWRRSEILMRVSELIEEKKDNLAHVIAMEAGKPISAARGEVDRAAYTFRIASEEARRIHGEFLNLDWLPGTEGRTAQVYRVPRGPVAGITPFNFPLNLVAHKVAPAMAAGNTILVRPASQTSLTALLLGKIITEAGWPAGAIAVLPSSTADAAALVEDERIKFLSFTGSPAVGWKLKASAGKKPVTLELGGNAGNIVHSDADLDFALSRLVWGGFGYAGQACISVQRIYIHEPIYEIFRDSLVEKVRALKTGNPLDPDTDVGPVIDLASAERIESWVSKAVDGGARVLTGGTREGTLWQPTVLENVSEGMQISCDEVFGPVVVLYRYDEASDAISAVTDSEYGLQAGLFTNNLNIVNEAINRIDVGGININDVSTFRIDQMPYGGVKNSGIGREGLRYTIEEMTEMKLVTYNNQVA